MNIVKPYAKELPKVLPACTLIDIVVDVDERGNKTLKETAFLGSVGEGMPKRLYLITPYCICNLHNPELTYQGPEIVEVHRFVDVAFEIMEKD